MTRIHKFFLLSLLVLIAPVVLVACGGDDSADVDPATVLRETFSNDEDVSSGTINLTLGGSVEGDEGGSGEATLSGPFQSDPDDPTALPQFDLTASLSGEAMGTSASFEGGLTVTEDNMFIEYQGTTYEVGTELFESFSSVVEQAAAQTAGGTTGAEGATQPSFSEQCSTLLETVGGNAAACDTIDVFSWFELTNEGEEEVEGSPTIHIHGTVDIPAMIENINAAIAAAEIPGATSIPEETASQIESAVSELSFDVYSGTEDRLLRGLDLNVSVDPTSIEGFSTENPGISAISGNFGTRLGAVNEPQTIDAPTDAQPIDDLLGQFGLSAADLETALGGYMTQFGLGGVATPPDLGGSEIPEIPDSGGGGLEDLGSGGGGGGSDDLDAYSQCILESTSNNPFKECEDLLAP